MKKPKHLLSVRDLTASQIQALLRKATQLKNSRGAQARTLTGKTLGLLFQKPSVRTRVSFEIGMLELGGQALYMDSVDLGGNKRERSKDLALVLSRYLDGIVIRTFAHQDAEELARAAQIPVINGLSDTTHPCQALGDLLTLQERFKKLSGVTVAFVGDGNNVCHALLEAAGLTGLSLKIATPSGHLPPAATVRWAQKGCQRLGGMIQLCKTPQEAVRGAAVVYTDVWTSMGQEKEGARRRQRFQGFQVDRQLMRQAGTQALFMHCLPAHRGEEVTDEVMDSPRSIVYDQAENRLHIQKAILLMLLK